MTYVIRIGKKAEKALDALERGVRLRIVAKIDGLATDPRPPGVKALQGKDDGIFRLRVGDYRVLYTVNDGELVVLVVAVGNRREVYR